MRSVRLVFGLGSRRHGCPSVHRAHHGVVGLFRTAARLRFGIRAHALLRSLRSSCGPTQPFLSRLHPTFQNQLAFHNQYYRSNEYLRIPSPIHNLRQRHRPRHPNQFRLRCPQHRHHRWVPLLSSTFRVS